MDRQLICILEFIHEFFDTFPIRQNFDTGNKIPDLSETLCDYIIIYSERRFIKLFLRSTIVPLGFIGFDS